jgi:hypothetical protein
MCCYSRTHQHFGTYRFFTMFTRAHYWSLSCARWIQSTPPYPSSLRSISLLSTNLYLHFNSGRFPSSFSTNILYAFFFCSIRTTCSAHLILFYLIILIMFGEEYSYDYPFITLQSKYSQTPSVYVPSLVRETMFHTHTKPQVKFQFCLMFMFLDNGKGNKKFWTEWQ